MADPTDDIEPPGESPTPHSAGPSEDMIQRFAALATGTHAAPPAADPLAPTFAGASAGVISIDHPAVSTRYTFEAVFASGGLGQIRRAYDHRLKRYVAVKELRRSHPGSSSELRFHREALLTARLEHPSIVPIHDLGEHPTGDAYYCMKLVDGRSLDTIVATCTSLVERLALVSHVVAVADALAYAHEKQIIHRDLKPGNVLVGSFGETVVIDWGLAKELSDVPENLDDARPTAEASPSAANDLTRTGDFVGTIPFMPPEQAERGRADARADVYAIGTMLYYVLSGSLPYQQSPAASMLDALLAGPPPDLGTRVPNLPADLLAIVRKAMARKPDDRYPSARELAADLRRFQTGRLVTARPYSTLDLLRHFVRTHRTAVLATSLSLLAISGIGIFSYLQVVDQKMEADTQRDQARQAQDHAERLTREANRGARDLYLESGRKKLFAEQNPQEALLLLNQAYKLDPAHEITKYLLAQSVLPLDALKHTLPYFVDDIGVLTYNKSGTRILFKDHLDDTYTVLDADTAYELASVKLPDESIRHATFSNDDERIIFAHSDGGTLARFEAETGKLLASTKILWRDDKPERTPIGLFTYLLDDSRILIADSHSALIANIHTGAIDSSIAFPAKPLLPVINPPTKTLTFVSPREIFDDNPLSAIYRWHPESGKFDRYEFNTDPDSTSLPITRNDLAFFVRAGTDKEVRRPAVLNLNSGTIEDFSPCKGIANDIHPDQMELALSADGETLLGASGNRLLQWDTRTRACNAISEQSTLVQPNSSSTNIYTSTADEIIYHAKGSTLLRFAYDTLAFRGGAPLHSSPLKEISLRPQGSDIISVPIEGDIRIWDFSDPRILNTASFRKGIQSPADATAYQRARTALRKPCSLLALSEIVQLREGKDPNTVSVEMDQLRVIAEPFYDTEHHTIRVSEGCELWGRDGRRYQHFYSSSLKMHADPIAPFEDEHFLFVQWSDPVSSSWGPIDTAMTLPDLQIVGLYPGFLTSAQEISRDLRYSWGFSIEQISPRKTVRPNLFAPKMAISPDNQYIVAADYLGGAIALYDAVTGSLVHELSSRNSYGTFTDSSDRCRMPNFSPTGDAVVISQNTGVLSVLDAITFEHIKSLRGHIKPVCGSAFDTTGTRLVTYNPNGGDEAFIWTLDDYADGIKLDSPNTSIAQFSPTGTLLATGDKSGVVRLWLVDGATQLADLRGHSAEIERLVFSQDGKRLYSMDKEENVIEWLIRRESRPPEQIQALIDQNLPYRLVDGRIVLK